MTNVIFGSMLNAILKYIVCKHFCVNDNSWFCLKCNSQLFPFHTLNNKTFMQHVLDSSNIKNKNENKSSNNLLLKPRSNPSSLFSQFNNTSQTYDDKDPDNFVKCKYYALQDVYQYKFLLKNSPLSLFHINTCCLSKRVENLEYLLKSISANFDIIEILETRILTW